MAEYVSTSIGGVDVLEANALQLSTSSVYPSVQIEEDMYGIVNHVINYDVGIGVTTVATIPHKYSGVPTSLIYVDTDDGTEHYTVILPWARGMSMFYIYAYADSSNVYIKINNQTGATLVHNTDFDDITCVFKYFIFPKLVA